MNIVQTYKVKGMHCASCASIIEKTFKKTPGVHSVEVNYGTETAKIAFDESKTNHHHLSKKIEKFGYSLAAPSADSTGQSLSEHTVHLGLDQSKQEKLLEVAQMKKLAMSAVPLAIFSIFVMVWDILAKYKLAPEMGLVVKEFFHHLLPLFAKYTLFVVGKQ